MQEVEVVEEATEDGGEAEELQDVDTIMTEISTRAVIRIGKQMAGRDRPPIITMYRGRSQTPKILHLMHKEMMEEQEMIKEVEIFAKEEGEEVQVGGGEM